MGGRLCARPRAGGRDFDEGAVERPGRPLAGPDRCAVPTLADPIKHVGVRLAGQPGCEGGGPGAKSGRGARPGRMELA